MKDLIASSGFRLQSSIPEDDDPRKPEIIPIDSQKFPGPGILEVHIQRAVGLTVPQYQTASKQPENAFSKIASMTNRTNLPKSDCQDRLLPYAILEWEGSEVAIVAFQGTRENPEWIRGERKFDIVRAGELSIHLYLGNLGSHSKGSQDILLGHAKMNPLIGDGNSHRMEWLPIENGTGKLLIESNYKPSGTLRIETSKPKHIIGECRFDYLYKIRKPSTNRFYASVNIHKVDILPHCDVVQAFFSRINDCSFIAPLKSIAQTRSYICLYWPFIPGGHLFYHLQQALRFQTDRARLYAAELVIALEQLHEVDPSYYEIKPKNILLDSVGHIVLCDLGLLHILTRIDEKRIDVTTDYLAPELLSGYVSNTTDTTVAKWWTLGSFLFEMLTGLPPFYDKDAKLRRHNILSAPLECSRSLPASARDLLNKLLTRKPEDRLGANGASEIKDHRFFDGIDWERVAWRGYEPAFKPHECEMSFEQERHRPIDQMSLEEQFSGWAWNTPPITKEQAAFVAGPENANEKKYDWTLIWQREDTRFYFYNDHTRSKRPIISNQGKRSRNLQGGAACAYDAPDANTDYCLPNAAQCQEALEAVLENQYMHMIPVLLKEYSIDLNIDHGFARTSPINYVTELEDAETVRLFLENGANANLNHDYTMGGQPLLTAVKKGNQELTEILVRYTDRIPCTRALAHAVSKRDIPIVNILLMNGVKCDFEDSDRPAGPGPCASDWDWGLNATMADASEPEEYIPPLVRAILLGDVQLVQLLLAHGADANVGYHDLYNSLPGISDVSEHFHMCCGRPIQLAMELGHHNVVQLLFHYGADIDIAQPVWQHHHCGMIPREAHHEIIAELRSVAVSVAA